MIIHIVRIHYQYLIETSLSQFHSQTLVLFCRYSRRKMQTTTTNNNICRKLLLSSNENWPVFTIIHRLHPKNTQKPTTHSVRFERPDNVPQVCTVVPPCIKQHLTRLFNTILLPYIVTKHQSKQRSESEPIVNIKLNQYKTFI